MKHHSFLLVLLICLNSYVGLAQTPHQFSGLSSAEANKTEDNQQYLPLNETDSISVLDGPWQYQQTVVHIYDSQCSDTEDVVSINGKYDTKVNYQYGPLHIPVYESLEHWNGAAWQDSLLYLESFYPGTCVKATYTDLSWNGVKWDTLLANRDSVIFHSAGSPQAIYDMKKNNGVWQPSQARFYSYNFGDTMISVDVYAWGGPGLLTPEYRDTNFIYSFYSDWCDAQAESEVLQSYSNGSWVNNALQTTNTTPSEITSLTFCWNGTSYDSCNREFEWYDQYHNALGYEVQNYDLVNKFWSVVNRDTNEYAYDVNGAILSRIHLSYYCSPNYDSLYRCEKYTFSGFDNCLIATGIQSQSNAESLSVFPNPSNGKLTVTFPMKSNEKYLIQILSMTGKEQFARNVVINPGIPLNLDVSRLSNGIYLLIAKNENHSYFTKLIKQ